MLYQTLVFTIYEKILKSHIRIIKISAPTLNEEFEWPDGSYPIQDIQDYCKYIFKKHGEKTILLSIKIYANKIENRIMFKFKIGYYLELLTPETMK